MESATNLVLVGPMGAGKSALGRRLADRLGLRFSDADLELERQAGMRIAQIFETEGESAFRQSEREVLGRLLCDDSQAIATGGGAVLDAGNRERLRARGFVVWLQASVDSQLDRLAHDCDRPLLQGGNRRETLLRLATERAPLYAAVADVAFDTNGQAEDEATDALVALLQQHWLRERP